MTLIHESENNFSQKIFKMHVDHIFGGHIYVISNYSVALNPLFWNSDNCIFFQKKVSEYLGSLCEIIGYSFCDNQFQMLIKTYDRQKFETFYRVKKKEEKIEDHEIPETGLIFSQEVSNLLNSFAKHFNHKYRRRGGLFAARYSKYLVETKEELAAWLEKMNARHKLVVFTEEWDVRNVAMMDIDAYLLSSNPIYEKRPLVFWKGSGIADNQIYPDSNIDPGCNIENNNFDKEKKGVSKNIQEEFTDTDCMDRCAMKEKKDLLLSKEEDINAGILEGKECYFNNFVHLEDIDLRGCFECLPPANYRTQNFIQFWGDFYCLLKYPPPW